jgi:hypothetical protein
LKSFGAGNDLRGVNELGTIGNVANVFLCVEMIRMAVVEKRGDRELLHDGQLGPDPQALYEVVLM